MIQRLFSRATPIKLCYRLFIIIERGRKTIPSSFSKPYSKSPIITIKFLPIYSQCQHLPIPTLGTLIGLSLLLNNMFRMLRSITRLHSLIVLRTERNAWHYGRFLKRKQSHFQMTDLHILLVLRFLVKSSASRPFKTSSRSNALSKCIIWRFHSRMGRPMNCFPSQFFTIATISNQ